MTTPVGSYAANPWGLYDMIGSVLVWCQNWYGVYPTDPVIDPQGVASGSLRVIHGCFWGYCGQYCRSAYRHGGDPSLSVGGALGIRAVLAPALPDRGGERR